MTAYVIAEEEVVLGFGLIGVAGSAPANREEALRAFAVATQRPEPLLLLITEAVAEWVADEIRDAVLGGKMVQVIPGVHAARERRPDSQTLLLSALGIKL
jgi:V/A-type H+/Na+-transporting ATPase subunit F